MSAPQTVPAPMPQLPWRIRMEMIVRLLAIQGSWNYEVLLGNGIGFALEPALRLLPGGPGGARYREALARECRYFNAHPYFASVAVGALARAELAGEPGARIERFRTAACGPLGSIGDRLVWASWLPFCSLVALLGFGAGLAPLWVVLLFLVLYNVGHLALRAWGLQTGWTHGLAVAAALGNPVFREGPVQLARAASFLAGIAIPLAMYRVIGPGRVLLGVVFVAAAAGGALAVYLQGKLEGWRIALAVLAIFALVSIATVV